MRSFYRYGFLPNHLRATRVQLDYVYNLYQWHSTPCFDTMHGNSRARLSSGKTYLFLFFLLRSWIEVGLRMSWWMMMMMDCISWGRLHMYMSQHMCTLMGCTVICLTTTEAVVGERLPRSSLSATRIEEGWSGLCLFILSHCRLHKLSSAFYENRKQLLFML